MTAIQCNHIVKQYGHVRALDGISFSLEEDKITGLIGRNGAGKTTLLRTIAGHVRESSGEIKVLDAHPFNNLQVLSNLVLVDDGMEFPDSTNLGQILNHCACIWPHWDNELALGLTNYFGLDLAKRHSSLSKGKKSTFNMIVGLSAHATVTLFDEPTTGMDLAVRKDFYRALLKDYIAHPRTILISSHLLGEIEDLLEDILLVKAGKIYAHMTTDELRQMAIGLRGHREILEPLIHTVEVFHQEAYGSEGAEMYLILRNTFEDVELEALRRSNVEIIPLSTDEVCVYLTSNPDPRGGIDDVFKSEL